LTKKTRQSSSLDHQKKNKTLLHPTSSAEEIHEDVQYIVVNVYQLEGDPNAGWRLSIFLEKRAICLPGPQLFSSQEIEPI
jgi:hypothetical protein